MDSEMQSWSYLTTKQIKNSGCKETYVLGVFIGDKQ